MILVNINFFSFAKILEFKKNEIRDIKLSKLIKLKNYEKKFYRNIICMDLIIYAYVLL